MPKDIECWGCDQLFSRYSTLLAHLEAQKCVVTRLQLDKLSVACPASKDFVVPGQENYLRYGRRNKYKAKAIFRGSDFYCSRCEERQFTTAAGLISHVDSSYHDPHAYRCPNCLVEFADLSGLLTHVESQSCDEKVSTGSIGKLLKYLWERIAS